MTWQWHVYAYAKLALIAAWLLWAAVVELKGEG